MRYFAITSVLFLSAMLFPTRAEAFHSFTSWDEAALDGGAGSVYFIGLPQERGWDCTLCHEGAPRRISAKVTSTPAELLSEGTAAAGALQKIVIELEGESLGARANVNAMSFALVDGDGGLAALAVKSANAMSGKSIEPMKGADNLPYRFTDGLLENVTRWEVEFFAPCQGEGDIYFGIVDGDGARDAGSKNQDPQGDDVVMGTRHFRVTGPACPSMASSHPAPGPPPVVRLAKVEPTGLLHAGVALLAVAAARMLRARR